METLVHAFVTFKLDNCNSQLLHELPKYLIQRLQSVQNCVARLVTRTFKFAHNTLVLRVLYWQRIVFKILLLTYKSVNNLVPSYI